MGRVFSPAEVNAGHVSLIPRHKEAARYVLANLFPDEPNSNPDLYIDEEPVFRSAIIYGSTVDGPGAKIRSDLDAAAIHLPGAEAANRANSVMEGLGIKVRDLFGVSLEPQLYPTGKIPIEKQDPMYAAHLVDIGDRMPEWCVNNPTVEFAKILLDPNDLDAHKYYALRYLYHKALSFDAAQADYAGFADYRALQRAFELASAIGRKVLPATKQPTEILPPISDKTGTRNLAMARIALHFGTEAGTALAADHGLLAKMDESYTEHLHQTLEGTMDIANYSNWLEDNYLIAIGSAERLSRAWAILLEDDLAKRGSPLLTGLDNLEQTTLYGTDDYT